MIAKMFNVDKKTVERKTITVIVNLSERIGRRLIPIHLHPGGRSAVQRIFTLPEIEIKRGVYIGKSVIAGNVRTEFNLSGKGQFNIDGVGRGAQKREHASKSDLFHNFSPVNLDNIIQRGIRVKRNREKTA